MGDSLTRRRGAASLRRGLVRITLLTLLLGFAALGSQSPRRDPLVGVGQVAAPVAFSIVGWEMHAAADAALRLLIDSREGSGRYLEMPAKLAGLGAGAIDADRIGDQAAVAAYRASAEVTARGRSALQAAIERRDETDTIVASARLRDLEARHAATLDSAGPSFARLVESALRDAGFPAPGVRIVAPIGIGFPRFAVTPPVTFAFARLPLNLVVARRDQIGIVGSVLIDSQLAPTEIDTVEARTDRTGVSSIVTTIGGLGTFPSMIPDVDPPSRVINIAAHEWTHHYLAFRRLGGAYFSDPAMREINETVADIVGNEIADRVAADRRAIASSDFQSPVSPPSTRSGPDFGTEMRSIRRHVEVLLERGSVAEAESYMSSERDRLAGLGLHVRKINTAYLSFFGAYSGGANLYEQSLRDLRSRSANLASFLDTVAEIASVDEFARVGGE
ncbi:MAG: hypothetical protein EPO26_04535 [Chloroflexota bacterium]|nr:MAG: hypothetical protein EPO26_04535 [Chloroflexota bacterium]